MSVFKPKTRMVSFRLSEEDYESLRQRSLINGAHSVSDYARLLLCRVISGQFAPASDPAVNRMQEMHERMEELDREVQRLASMVERYSETAT